MCKSLSRAKFLLPYFLLNRRDGLVVSVVDSRSIALFLNSELDENTSFKVCFSLFVKYKHSCQTSGMGK